MTVVGVVFTIALFVGVVVLNHFTRKKFIDEPIQKARESGSPVAEFVDDLRKNRWIVIIGIALVVAATKILGISGGPLQSRFVLAILITAVFVGRMLLRRRRQ